MDAHRKDALAKALGDTRLSARFDRWLWFFMNRIGYHFEPTEFGSEFMRDRVAEIIEGRPFIKTHINSEKNRALMGDASLKWITNDDRQHQWLIPRIKVLTGISLETPAPTMLGRDLIVTMIDLWDRDANSKRQGLEFVKIAWDKHKKDDHIFRWFKEADSAQRCAVAWDWFCKNEAQLTKSSPAIESYDELLKFFDSTSFSTEGKELKIEFIKKRWSQQKYRKNLKGKKQYNFILSDKTVGLLDKLAETYDLKRPQIIEILIQMESENGIHIPEKMKIIRNL